MKKIGLIVNPVAGIGGKAGLKGSDGAEIQKMALDLGVEPEAGKRAAAALNELNAVKGEIMLYTAPGVMGEDSASEAGFTPTTVGATGAETSAADTIAIAQEMASIGVDLLMFAGGDGTARNICEAIGDKLPVLGIPAGVKIHSAVYAVNPRSAGQAVLAFCRNAQNLRLKEAEVMDIDENAFRQGHVQARLYGYAMVPELKNYMQSVKSGGYSEQSELAGIAADVVANMKDDVFYLIGPGTTTRPIMEALGLPHTLLGVDVVQNRQLVAADVNERDLFQIIQDHPAHIVITVIGGQGHIFGRGNQQFSRRVLWAVRKENITVIATRNKLFGLEGRAFWVDTGDADLDAYLSGYIRVTINFQESMVFPIKY